MQSEVSPANPKASAQRGMDRLEHDIAFVSDVLVGLEADECVAEEDPDPQWLHYGNFRIYIFHVELEDEVDLYIKIALHIENMSRAQLLSYKPWGSPE
jgi:hypothetical protein